MPELNFSLQPSFLALGQSAPASDAGIFKGADIAQRNKDRAVQEKQVNAQLARDALNAQLQPYRMREADLKVQDMAADMAWQSTRRELENQAAKTFNDEMPKLLEMQQAGDPFGAYNAGMDMLMRFPILGGYGPMKESMEMLKGGVQLKINKDKANNTFGGEPELRTFTDPEGNEHNFLVRPNSRGQPIEVKSPVTKDPVKEQEISRQVADEETISGRAWTDQERTKRTAELRLQTSLAPKSQYHITMDKEGNLVFDSGPGVATVGAQTKFQTELANLQASTQQIETAASSLREKDFGVSGKVWEGINRWVTQIAPEVGDPNVAANRVNVSRAVENYLSTQQAKGRLTADERAEMRQALVSLSAGESFPRAEAVFKRMAKLQRMDAITIAKSGKQALQPWMFQGLEQSKDAAGPKDFSNLVNSGTLTKEEAALWYEKVNPGAIK